MKKYFLLDSKTDETRLHVNIWEQKPEVLIKFFESYVNKNI